MRNTKFNRGRATCLVTVFLGLFSPLMADAAGTSAQRTKDAFSTSVTTMSGSVPFNQKAKFSLVVRKKNPVSWQEALFQTDSLTTLRVSDSSSGRWSLLPSSLFKIMDTPEEIKKNPSKRSVKLISGTLRMQAIEVENHAGKGVAKSDIIVETNEMRIFVPLGADLVVSRKKNSSDGAHYLTNVYVLNGSISFLPLVIKSAKNKTSESDRVPLSPGAVFSISDSGVIAPFVEPDGNDIDQVLAFTTTPEELLAKQRSGHGFTVNELVEKCAVLEKNSDYFGILDLFDGFKNDFKNNEQIPYCLGIANEGLNQRQDAIRYFNVVVGINPNNVEAHWHLAQIYLKEKNYEAARKEFEAAHGMLDKQDKRYFEHQYYMAVIDFFEKKYLSAKSLFENCSSDENLDSTLKRSVGGFLAKIPVKKPWSLIVPTGITYDNNVLSIGRSESLPAEYSSKSTWKTFAGAVFDYDRSLADPALGWFLGGEGKTFYVKNLRSEYNGLDALILEGSLFETNRIRDKDSFRLYQTSGMIFLDQHKQTFYLLAGAKYKMFDFNAGEEWDVSETAAEDKATDTVFNQYYSDSYGKYGWFMWSMNVQLQEKISKNRTAAVGDSIEPIVSPQMAYMFNPRTNVSFTPTLDFYYLRSEPQSYTYRFQPTLAVNYFVTKWLLGTVSGVYEYDITQPGREVAERPQGTFSLTGIF